MTDNHLDIHDDIMTEPYLRRIFLKLSLVLKISIYEMIYFQLAHHRLKMILVENLLGDDVPVADQDPSHVPHLEENCRGDEDLPASPDVREIEESMPGPPVTVRILVPELATAFMTVLCNHKAMN